MYKYVHSSIHINFGNGPSRPTPPHQWVGRSLANSLRAAAICVRGSSLQSYGQLQSIAVEIASIFH